MAVRHAGHDGRHEAAPSASRVLARIPALWFSWRAPAARTAALADENAAVAQW